MTNDRPLSIETVLIVKGVVQGVFFRKITKQHADALGMTGYVRNLSDGNVEICIASGDVEELIRRLKSEPPPIQIDSISTATRETTGPYQAFGIL